MNNMMTKNLLIAVLAMLSFLPKAWGQNIFSKERIENMPKASATLQNIQGTKTDLYIQGSVGRLAATLQKPMIINGGTVPLVIIMHGLVDNKEVALFSQLADSLQLNGIASIRFDFNGHGKSEGEFVNVDWDKVRADADSILKYARTLDFVNGISLAGHSMGGVVASMLAGKEGTDNIQSEVLFAPAGSVRDDALRGSFFDFDFDPQNIPDTIHLFERELGANLFKTAQPLPIFETAEKYQGRLYVIHGTHDSAVPYTYGERYVHDNPNGKIQLLEGYDHDFSQGINLPVSLATRFFKQTLLQGDNITN